MFGEIKNAERERLEYTWVPGAKGDASIDVVVIGHGVTANMDRPWLVALSEALTAAGIASLRISFSGNGGSEGRFEDSTISKEVDDLGAVLDALGDRRIIYAGHSMGGAVGVLRTAIDTRITALVSLAGMTHTEAFARRKFGDQTPGQSLMWDKPECPLSQAFMDDMVAIESVIDEAASIDIPWLLVHGTADEVVPPKDSHDAVAAAGGRPFLVELDGADHIFSGDATAAMTAAVVPWVAHAFD